MPFFFYSAELITIQFIGQEIIYAYTSTLCVHKRYDLFKKKMGLCHQFTLLSAASFFHVLDIFSNEFLPIVFIPFLMAMGFSIECSMLYFTSSLPIDIQFVFRSLCCKAPTLEVFGQVNL